MKSISSPLPHPPSLQNSIQKDSAPKIKVLTWNPNSLKCQLNPDGFFYFKSYFKIKKLLAKDTLICIQDASLNNFSLRILKTNFNIYYSPPNKGLSILVPKNFQVVDYNVHPNHRIQRLVQISNDHHKSILFNIYGPPTKKLRDKIVFLNELDDYILESVEKYPLTDVILAGDFNIAPDKNDSISKKLKNIMNKYSLIDCYRNKHPSIKEFPGYTRYPYKNQIGQPTRIDLIFINEKYTNTKIQLTLANSDHKMIYMHTKEPKKEGKPRNKTNIKSFSGMLFDSSTHSQNLSQLIQLNRTGNPEEIFESVITDMHSYSEQFTKNTLKDSSIQIQKTLTTISHLEKNYSKLTPSQKTDYKTQTNKLISLLRDKELKIAKLRGSYFQEYGQRGTRQYFQMIKAKAQSQTMTSANINGKSTNDPDEIANHIFEYYSTNLKKDPNVQSSRHYFENPIFKDMHNIYLNNPMLNGDITDKETIAGTEKLNSNSVPGIDGVSAAMIKNIAKQNTKIITNYLNHLIHTGSDKAFKTMYKILRKQGKNYYENIKNYRPIALMCMCTRLLDKVILNRIYRVVHSKPLETFDHNIAYKKGYDPRDIIALILDSLDLIKKTKNDNACIISIDFSKAFDSISHRFIIDYLDFLGFPKQILLFLEKRFSQTTGQLKDYESSTTQFLIEKGILQGSALSGFLFILCLNPLLHSIEKDTNITPIQINLNSLGLKKDHLIKLPVTSAFADDVNLILNIDFEQQTSPQIEAILEKLDQFKKITGLNVNLTKTFAYTSAHTKTIEQLSKLYQIENKSKEIIRVLGHHFIPQQHLNSIHQLNRITASLAKQTQMLNKAPLQGRYIITNTFLSTKINFHTTQLNHIYKKDTKRAQQIINNYIKAPYTGNSKYQTFAKGGAQVNNLDILIATGKLNSYRSYMHSNHSHKLEIRNLLQKFGFNLHNLLNAGIKQHNLALCLLDHLGLTRLRIIFKQTFDQIRNSNIQHMTQNSPIETLNSIA